MEFFSVKEVSNLWGVSERWIQKLCECGRIEGALRFGRSWMIPRDAKRPDDQRKTNKKE